MKYKVSKIGVAVIQLDWAIRLFLDYEEREYVAAITLAGAAEEILGRSVGEKSAFNSLKIRLSQQYELEKKDVSQKHLNKAKNWMKHWDNLTDYEETELDLEQEAMQLIFRAMTNLLKYDRSLPSEGPRFMEWIKKYRPDLIPPP